MTIPIMVSLLFLMGVGRAAVEGASREQLRQLFVWPAITAAAIVIAALAFGMRDVYGMPPSRSPDSPSCATCASTGSARWLA